MSRLAFCLAEKRRVDEDHQRRRRGQMFVEKPLNQPMRQHSSAPRCALKMAVILRPDWWSEVLEYAQTTTRCEIRDRAREMILNVVDHRWRDQSRWIEHGRKPLIAAAMPESHLPSDIAEQVGVVGDDCQCFSARTVAE